jgi:hypothetical protein
MVPLSKQGITVRLVHAGNHPSMQSVYLTVLFKLYNTTFFFLRPSLVQIASHDP